MTTPQDQPLLPDIGVLAFVPDRWSRIWQPRHHVLTRLGRYFHVVLIDPVHEWRQTLTRVRSHATPDTGTSAPPGFTIYRAEAWLPRLFRPEWLADLLSRQRLERSRGILASRGCKKTVLYLWRPEFEPMLRAVPSDVSCYHIDDEYSWSEVEVPLSEGEARLIAGVDQVFIHSPALLEKKGSINPRTAFVPNGVDYQAHATAVPEPFDLASIPRPRIGYTGYLKTQLDLSLLSRLADQHPEWSFVFVGALQHQEIAGAIEELSRRQNVHFLGAKPVDQLATYPQHFDVCIMPYVVDGYTKFIYPLKLHEYLASGRPVVGTRIRSLEEFTDVVTLASHPDEWSAAIANALSPAANTAERRAARQAVAHEHDWEVLVARIAGTLAERLGPEFAERWTASVEATRDTGSSVISRAPALST